MDEEQPVHDSSQAQPIHVKHAHKFIFGYFILIVLVAALASVYNWQHNKVESLHKNVSALNTEVSKANSALASLQNKNQSTLIETDTLDDGMKIKYPLTTSTANVIWWSQDYYDTPTVDTKPSGTMVLSDKRVTQFLSLIPSSVLQPICGDNSDNFNDIDIQMGIYDPVTKVFSHNQYANCISLVGGSSTKYASQAQQVAAQASSDLNAFEKSIVVVK